MKKALILLAIVGLLGACGSDDEEEGSTCSREICDPCTKHSQCCEGTCQTLFDLATGLPVGRYCVDTPDRVCDVG